MKEKKFYLCFTFILILITIKYSHAQKLSLSANADLVSRYVWRGLNINDQPNIQPAITFKLANLQFGFWGSYGLSHTNSTDELHNTSHEIDSWISYSIPVENIANITAVVTDYYYPNGGIRIGNFHNYDDKNGQGAHTIEAGLSIAGVESFPLTLCCYMNVYNDKGNNIYFQAEYTTTVDDFGLSFFAGAAFGSKDTPLYYGTDKFSLINTGIKASKQIKISESFSLPVYCSYTLNPKAEISYMVFGISI
ncbi:MAG: hypothetical protein HYZ10_15815 [Ignavibacteriales bacterium]|nr:hypothetical protein [Ignavibacteriales bacterium]